MVELYYVNSTGRIVALKDGEAVAAMKCRRDQIDAIIHRFVEMGHQVIYRGEIDG